MADNQAGIMALPDNQDMQAPTLGMDDTYDAVKQALGAARPDAAVELDSTLAGLKGIADELTEQQLDSLLQIIQYTYDNPDKYKEIVAKLVSADVIDEGDLPAEYDPEFLSTFGTILLEERKSRGADQPPFPEKFARGGIAEAARIVASQGRSGDTMLAHITPEEARLLRKRGGMGTINPATGLPEFGFFSSIGLGFVDDAISSVGKAVKSVFKSVAGAVKSVVASPIGKVVATVALATFLGPAGMGIANAGWASAIASGTTTLAAGGNIKDAVKSAAFSYFVTPSTPATATTPAFSNPVSDWVGDATAKFAGSNEFVAKALENQYVKTAVTGFGTGTIAGALTGQSLQEAVKGGLMGAAISTGVQAAGNTIQNQAANAKAAAAAVDTLDEYNAATRNAVAQQEMNYRPASDILNAADDTLAQGQKAVSNPSTMQADAIKASQARLGNPAVSPEFAAPSYDLGGKGPGFVPPSGTTSVGLSTPPRLSDTVGNLDLGGYPSSGGITPAAGSPTAAPATAGYKVPGVLDSAKQIGGGIMDIAKGDFSKGYNQIVQGGENLFFPGSPSTSDVVNSPDYQNAINSNVPAEVAFKEAQKSLTPGLLRTYGPATAAGIAGLAATGAFNAPEPPKSEQAKLLEGTPGEDLIAKDADKYVVQNIPGLTYSPEGQILFATGAPSTISMQDVRVGPADYTATMQDVSRPTGSYAAAPMGPMQNQEVFVNPFQQYYEQQYLPSQYRPRYYAMGGITSLSAPMQAPPPAGIAALSGGGNSNYPRRTGQISGPGTEKSDSIPAMLSDGEFVMTAAAVRGMGKGSRREGAKRMYALMHQLEKNAARG